MTYQMNRPDQELAYKILSTVPYRDRLPAGRLMPPVGMLRGDVRSLHELRLLLTPDVRSLCVTRLQKRWRESLWHRHAGADFKPPQAAVVIKPRW